MPDLSKHECEHGIFRLSCPSCGQDSASEVTLQVEHKFICEINNLLTDARENAQQLLTEHDEALGRNTKKNERIANMYIDEINSLDKAISRVRQMVI